MFQTTNQVSFSRENPKFDDMCRTGRHLNHQKCLKVVGQVLKHSLSTLSVLASHAVPQLMGQAFATSGTQRLVGCGFFVMWIHQNQPTFWKSGGDILRCKALTLGFPDVESRGSTAG